MAEENRRLRQEVAELRRVNEILRAASSYFASELCANAVHHGRGTTNSLVLRAWAEGNDIVLQAEDDGSGFDPPQRYDDELPDPEAVAGRGLFLIQSLSDGVRVERSDNRTIVQVRKEAILSITRLGDDAWYAVGGLRTLIHIRTSKPKAEGDDLKKEARDAEEAINKTIHANEL